MAALLDQLRIVIEQVIRSFGYPGITAIMFIENIFPPIPSEVVMPFAGFLVSDGIFSFIWVITAGTLGALIGAVAIYYLGYRMGEEGTREWFRKYGKYILVSEEEFSQALEIFNRHGKVMVLIGRIIPGVRSLISIPAGIKNMGWKTFLLYTVIGTTIWNIILAGGGMLLKSQWQQILAWLDQYQTIVYIIFGALIVYWVGRKLWQYFQGKGGGQSGFWTSE